MENETIWQAIARLSRGIREGYQPATDSLREAQRAKRAEDSLKRRSTPAEVKAQTAGREIIENRLASAIKAVDSFWVAVQELAILIDDDRFPRAGLVHVNSVVAWHECIGFDWAGAVAELVRIERDAVALDRQRLIKPTGHAVAESRERTLPRSKTDMEIRLNMSRVTFKRFSDEHDIQPVNTKAKKAQLFTLAADGLSKIELERLNTP